MTSFFSFPRASLAAILAALAALFPLPSHAGPDITTPSPDGRWTIIARRTPVNEGGYLYELRDNTTNKTFLKQTTFQKNDIFPARLNVLWSPGSTRVALNLYYGRIAYWITVIDTAGKSPMEIPLTPLEKGAYADYLTGANRWLNRTDLEITATRPPQWQEGRVPGKEVVLVLRFAGRGLKIIKKSPD